MSRSLFDRQIHQKLYTFESEVPAHLWDDIASKIPRKKRRFGYWFWILGIGTIGLSLWFSLGINVAQNTGTPIPKQTQIVRSESPTSALPAKDNVIFLTDSSHTAGVEPVTNLASDISSITRTNGITFSVDHGPKVAEVPIARSPSFIEKGNQVNTLSKNQTALIAPSEISNRSNLNLSPLPAKSVLLSTPLIKIEDPKIIACPPFSSRGLALDPFLEINAFAGLPVKSLEPKTEEYLNYKRLRENSESVKSSFTLQALVGLQIGEKVEVKSGLGYTALFELFDYIDENASRTITNIVIDTIFDNNGNFVIHADTSIITEYGRHIKKTNNRYSLIDIPFMAGYAFNIKNHNFIIEAGASLNLWLGAKGNILSPTEEIINLAGSAEPTSPILNKRSGWNFEGAVGYQISLSETSALRIKAGLSYPISDISHPDYPISQKYRQWRLGLSWKHRL